jgi:hypothetical protein
MLVDQSCQILEPLDSKMLLHEVRIFDRPNEQELSSFQIFCNATVQFNGEELFRYIRLSFSRKRISENEKEKFFDVFTRSICSIILNNALEFAYKIMVMIQNNVLNPNLNSILEFINQNFDQIVANNQQQFEILEIKLTVEYRDNTLTALKIDITKLKKVFNPYELSEYEFECFTPLFKNMSSSKYSF